jgi:GrpB-like predicted nucleotidyltransferase (UPF0157 family)
MMGVMSDFQLIGGVERRDIVIVPYDPAWPLRFVAERDRIATALGPLALRVDHIGSTSVPGLAAKPIIDIDLSVPDIEDEPVYLPSLEAAGYRLRVRETGHRMVRTPQLDVHLHICQTGSDWERRHLLLRDWLRINESDRLAYAELKHRLSQQDWPDMNAYADAKGPLIVRITARAEQWAAETGWSVSGSQTG